MRRSKLSLVVFAMLNACTGWARVPAPGPTDPPSSQLLEVWSHDLSFLVDELRIDGDSMRGILRNDKGPAGPFVLARIDVDSVRTTDRAVLDAGLLVGAAVAFFYLYIIRASAGD